MYITNKQIWEMTKKKYVKYQDMIAGLTYNVENGDSQKKQQKKQQHKIS